MRLAKRVDGFGEPGDVGEFITGQLGDQTGHGVQPGARNNSRCLARSSEPPSGAWAGSSSWTRHSNRLIVEVRCATRTSRRSTNNFSSRDTSSWEATGKSGSRRTARATARRVDRIRLAPGACRGPSLGHQLRRHPHHLLTGAEQVALQPRRQMPAILDRPHHLAFRTAPGPTSPPRPCPAVVAATTFSPSFSPHLIDGDKSVRALVYIGSNNNHGGCLLHCEVTVGPVGGHISVGAVPRSYQVTPAGPSHLMPTKRMNANPKAAPSATSQTPGDQDPTTATSGNLTLTLRRC